MTESVWDYPRPPKLEPSARRVRIELGGRVIADSRAALRILETSHPPTIYIAERCACTYPDPVASYAALRDHVAVYPGRMDACWLDDERVRSQEGDFYGGWITADITGPFKGGPGTFGW